MSLMSSGLQTGDLLKVNKINVCNENIILSNSSPLCEVNFKDGELLIAITLK